MILGSPLTVWILGVGARLLGLTAGASPLTISLTLKKVIVKITKNNHKYFPVNRVSKLVGKCEILPREL